MINKIVFPIILLLVAYFVTTVEQLKIIIAGIAIFLVGMGFMEDGFKQFSGGVLEKIVEKFTNSIAKAISTGFVLTAIVQSSSLVSVIVISFLSAELIGLAQAIGVIFGSNIGTTTTAWIISAFGLKIKIAQYAMPMLILGVILKFSKSGNYRGFGYILLGLGFIFLGIGYMKDGFDTLKDAIDLAQYSIDGLKGLLVYILIGVAITIVIQSSSATMAVIITALVSGQIIYVNALALAIGSNLGTTITAIIGSISSNENGKRLAVAHLIFNLVTALFAIVFIYQLSDLVDYLAQFIGIKEEDYGMKLALFHTIFNIIGVIIMTPFINTLNNYLMKLFVRKSKVQKPKYIDDAISSIPQSATISLNKEIKNLYDIVEKTIFKALYLEKEIVYESQDLKSLILISREKNDLILDKYYEDNIKPLYGEIIRFASLSQEYMKSSVQLEKIGQYKLASRVLIEALKDMDELQENLKAFLNSKDKKLRDEYDFIREELSLALLDLRKIYDIESDDLEQLTKLELLKDRLKELDLIRNNKVNELFKEGKLSIKNITSLINDYSYAKNILKKLIRATAILVIDDNEIQELGENSETL